MAELSKEITNLIRPEDFLKKIRDASSRGKSSVIHNLTAEGITLDVKWIDEIEDGLFHIEKVIKDPKSFIRDQEYIVDVEKAKKINSRTVRHLASHTKNIASVEENGDIRPKRVLTIENEEEMGIYENRFIAALIERLQIFVEKRYKEINERMSKYDVTALRVDSNFPLGSSLIEYNLSLTLKEPPAEDDKVFQKNKEDLSRIDAIRKRIKILTNTSFYRQMSQLKPVRPPIAKTNILKLNVDYSSAYKLWLYISSYTFVGYSVITQDKLLPVDGDYYDDLTVLTALSVKALIDNDEKRKERYQSISPKPIKKKKYRVLTQLRLEPSFRQDKSKLDEDAVNEYYYDKIKSALAEASQLPQSYDMVEEKKLDIAFSKFVRMLGNINYEMYDELIRSHSQAVAKKNNATLKGKELEIKQQEKTYKRYLMLSKLKSAELEKALRAESREFLRLEKMKADLELQREKEKIVRQPKKEQSGTDEPPEIKKARIRNTKKVTQAKTKGKTVLEKKVKQTRAKTKKIKEDLFSRDLERLMEIAKRNQVRKDEQGKKSK